jgi:hypothetical protein
MRATSNAKCLPYKLKLKLPPPRPACYRRRYYYRLSFYFANPLHAIDDSWAIACHYFLHTTLHAPASAPANGVSNLVGMAASDHAAALEFDNALTKNVSLV